MQCTVVTAPVVSHGRCDAGLKATSRRGPPAHLRHRSGVRREEIRPSARRAPYTILQLVVDNKKRQTSEAGHEEHWTAVICLSLGAMFIASDLQLGTHRARDGGR